MELLVASGIGVLTAAGVWLLLRAHTFPVMLGLTLLSYAVNVFIFSMGRLAINAPPVIREGVERYTDPLPQALVLTAIVIAFGMTALLLALALRLNLDSGSDHVDCELPDADASKPAPGSVALEESERGGATDLPGARPVSLGGTPAVAGAMGALADPAGSAR